MIVLSFILYCVLRYSPGSAAPVISFAGFNTDIASSLFARDTDALCTRTRIEIVWSCIATILAASWVSVHPNLPHPRDSKLKKTLLRIELMIWAIVTPELIIYWAMRQWYGAWKMEREFSDYLDIKEEAIFEPNLTSPQTNQHERQSGKIMAPDFDPGLAAAASSTTKHGNSSNNHKVKCNDFKWTRTHGFFLQMGGFVLLEGKKKRVLGWKTLMKYYRAGKIDLSDITEASINDHSKADGFAKGLALLQTCWFIIQCIARFADHHLVLTELELVTAALAALSLAMYFLWWNKPFNVEIPIVLTLSGSQVGYLPDDFNDQVQGENKAEKLASFINLKNMLCIFIQIWKRIEEILSDYGGKGEDPTDNEKIPIMKVPTFYSIETGAGLEFVQMIWTSFSIAALFGAIHCAGWSSKIIFSSHASLLLWRISSAIITGSPLVWNLIFVFGYAQIKSEPHSVSQKVYKILTKSLYFLSAPTVPLYIVSRLILLILAFVEITNVPPGALNPIQWADIIPFIH